MDLDFDNGLTAKGNYLVKTHKIKREIVALVMESPLYFTIPLRKRLDFIKFLSQQTVFDKVSDLDIGQMKGKC
jgi:hypothetical protein